MRLDVCVYIYVYTHTYGSNYSKHDKSHVRTVVIVYERRVISPTSPSSPFRFGINNV